MYADPKPTPAPNATDDHRVAGVPKQMIKNMTLAEIEIKFIQEGEVNFIHKMQKKNSVCGKI